jgi:hypothetical protein
MYVTADGNDETVLAEKYTNILHVDEHSDMAGATDVAAVKGLRSANVAKATATGNEISVESVDVKKVGKILTDDTPDGRMLLLDYFKKVERQIATETAGREKDIAAIRTQMAKNRAYNAKARNQMKHMLLKKMAENAKAAKAALDEQMRITAVHFAKVHEFENKRNRKTIKRNRKTREIMRKNKKANKHALHMAVLNQQRALATLDQKTNVKLKHTNQNIAANAAQIKSNALKARKELDDAASKFSKKMYNAREEAKKGRSKLAAQAATMDKKVRAMINLKVSAAIKYSAQQFQKVRAKMAKDRHHADMMLAQASLRMTSALAASAALQNTRFAKTVADISAAKAEAAAAVKKASQGFKLQILALSSKVKADVSKLNKRETDLGNVVTNNRLEQAKVNDKVTKEVDNMIAIGNKREAKLKSNDEHLRNVMAKNKADTQANMDKMAKQFYMELTKIRDQMAKDRKHQEGRLKKSCAGLFSTLAKNQAEQDKQNEKLTAATRRARLDADEALREAKHGFATRLGALHTTVTENDKKATKKIEKLTGIEAQNAQKSIAGQKLLRQQSQANKNELKVAIRNAVAAGEKRARQVEAMAKKMNKKTQAALNSKITTEISTLTKSIHSDVEGLQLQTAEARKAMKAEILYALRSEQKILKDQLATTVKWANKKFVALDDQLEKEKSSSAAGRAALKKSIDSEKEYAQRAIQDAVQAQASALLALKQETEKNIKKTNTDVSAYGKAIEKHAESVKNTMKKNVNVLETKIAAAKSATQKALGGANAKSAARHATALDSVRDGLELAKKETDNKFAKVYSNMGANRAAADSKLADATRTLNKRIAAHAALEDVRFAKTVKDVSKAKAKAWADVTSARKFYTMGLAEVTAEVKASETRLVGEIGKAAQLVIDERALQARVNKKVSAEIGRIEKLSDIKYSENKKARGKVKELMNKNKVVAQQEVKDLRKASEAKLSKVRAYMARLRNEAATDLTHATKLLHEALGKQQAEQNVEMEKLTNSLQMASVTTKKNLASTKKAFTTKYTILVNTVTANNKAYEQGLKEVTGVAHSWKVSSSADRALIKDEAKTMNADLNKAIVKAIQLGEAKAKEVEDRGNTNIEAMKKALTIEIGEQVERMADTVLKTVLSDRGTIANNYLSLKGYAGAAQDTIMDYVQKGKGRGLSSIGEFLQAVAAVSAIKTKAAEGITAGSGKLTPPFGGAVITEVRDINKVNGLVNEYMNVYSQVRMAYPYGIGKYLLEKLADSMTKGGVLTIGKKSGASGQWVYLNGKTLGLSSRMSEFGAVGARLTHYQSFLAKLSAKLPHKEIVKPLSVAPPEWQGN